MEPVEDLPEPSAHTESVVRLCTVAERIRHHADEARRLATVLLGLSNELDADGLIESADAIMSAARKVAEEANLAVRKTCSDEVWDAYRDAQVYLATRVRQIQKEIEDEVS
jgi:hypothetical protein